MLTSTDWCVKYMTGNAFCQWQEVIFDTFSYNITHACNVNNNRAKITYFKCNCNYLTYNKLYLRKINIEYTHGEAK